PADYTPQGILWENQIPYAALFRKRLWERVGGYDPSLSNMPDWNFWIAASRQKPRVHRVAENLLLYRVRREENLFFLSQKHYPVFSGMIRTLHPDLYQLRCILTDHQRISDMATEVLARVERTIGRHLDLPQPYLWRGLRRERERR